MGASVSTSKQKYEQNLENSIEASCPKTECSNLLETGDIEIGGAGNTLNVKQECTATSNCVMEHALKTAAETIARSETGAKAGLGFAVSASTQDVRQNLKNKIAQNCGSTAALNKAKLKSIKFLRSSTGNTFNFSQKGDAASQCQLSAIGDLVGKLDGQSKTDSAGYDPSLILIVFAIVAVIGIGAYLVLRNKLAL